MYDPMEKSISQLQTALSEGKVTSEELCQFYLQRIDAYDRQGPGLNAIVEVHPKWREQAKTLDEERACGKIRGPLHGIPLVIKDNFNTWDQPTTAGSEALRGSQPGEDAFVIQKLRQAGAVLLAKTNLSEFARHGLTVGSLIGQTKNPYDFTRTPGGSSGGTGAAVAANFAAAGLGSDTVNSIRSPSSACCLVGLRPTTGLLSRSGIVPCSSTQDTGGPLARWVTDVAILMDACVGIDPNDPVTKCHSGHVPSTYLSCLKKDGLKGKRIGLLKTNFGTDSEILQVMKHVETVLNTQGAETVNVEIPEFASARVFQECDVQRFETKPLMDAYFSSVPNCPVSSLKELVEGGKIHPTIYADLKACADLENPLEQPEYKDRLGRIARNRAIASEVMEREHVDAFCYPHQQILVVKIGEGEQGGRNGILAATLGWPAITLPGGFSTPEPTAPLGVPIGVEFMGAPWSEETLLEMAYTLEQALSVRQPPLL